jgi:hypothetical protein
MVRYESNCFVWVSFPHHIIVQQIEVVAVKSVIHFVIAKSNTELLALLAHHSKVFTFESQYSNRESSYISIPIVDNPWAEAFT